MKNQYFADINDYLKYGLLRCFSQPGFRVGVCWMLTANDQRSDGRKIRYLTEPKKWRRYDPALFDCLADAVKRNTRTVRHIEHSGLLDTASFIHSRVPDNKLRRRHWLNESLKKLNGTDLIFFDPDNGIEVKSKPYGSSGSCKFIFWAEIQIAWAQGKALLIFQHFCREKRDHFINRLVSRLEHLLGGPRIVAITSSNVLYLLVFKESQQAPMELGLQNISKRWGDKLLVRQTG